MSWLIGLKDENEFQELELMHDRITKILKEIIEQVENALNSGEPYFIVRKREIQRNLSGSRGLQFIIKQLKRRYKIVEDGSWYIISLKK